MTTPATHPPATPRWRVLLLAALTALLALLFGAGTASAAALPAAETRVGAITPAVSHVVGVAEHIAAGQHQVRAPSQSQIVVGHCVAAEEGTALEGAAARCGLSFAADTLVVLADGKTKPISQLKIGDKVLATNTRTGKTQSQVVTAVLLNHDTDLIDLDITDGSGHRSIVHTTAKHPIWDQTRDTWVQAAQLHTGDVLRGADGRGVRVLGLLMPQVTSGDMWDLTVANDHDFYVTAGAAAILVHNCTGTPRPGLRPEKPTDPPSWVKQGGHYGETTDPNPTSAARRIMDEQYPDGWPTPRTGGGSEYSQVQKWLSRYFSWG